MDTKKITTTSRSPSYTSVKNAEDVNEDPEAQMIESEKAKKAPLTLRTNRIIVICILVSVLGLAIVLLIHFQPWCIEESPMVLDIKNQTEATTELIQVGKRSQDHDLQYHWHFPEKKYQSINVAALNIISYDEQISD